ncbi:MAG: sodium:calcium antiporter [Candidatus Methylophosphatis roskildensis]|uniref:Sodium:calcium antiporter n=1 Tax=Candidatus Methylophosphatis roskildensis TaxID=2899263 RepID=A0A9D7E2M4_9PROT|nr:sodium:calcium antiporter [Candidatus Methylophosphatis roskildensis]MBK7234142.1 sodium:calcium antiporter [Sterolibacteriaceae bacterium]MBK7662521.1 sodium:calcium antiporter [Sterolibacteriaceae bacterium]MBK9086633.1 sodium:calcium antiporter [Sterolibacteriaceae bacterium]
MIGIWLEFLVCTIAIAIAGAKLTKYGDIIAARTGMGGTWIGVVLLATVTSLPELVTGLSAVTVANAPNIAVGDVLGSCVFNLTIVAVLDFLLREESIYRRAHQGHILAAGFGVLMIGLVGMSLLLEPLGRLPAIGHVGLYTPLILLLYFTAMRSVFRYEKAHMAEAAAAAAAPHPGITLAQASTRYAAAAAVIVAAGLWLPFIGKQMAAIMGWQTSFVGTLFIAFATSVPELAVTIAALRIGALDMAIGNVLGSNLFDILIVAIDDIAFLPGPLLGAVSSVHLASVITAMMMSGLVVVGLLYRPHGRVLGGIGWASLLLLMLFAFNSYVLYLHGE